MHRKLIRAVLCLVLAAALLGPSAGYAGNVVVGSGNGSSTNGYISAMSVSFRSGPGLGYSVLHVYNTGKQIEIISASSGWTKCRIDGLTGYVLSDYVCENAVTPAAAATPAATPTPTPTAVIPSPDSASSGSGTNSNSAAATGGGTVISSKKNTNPFTAATPKVSATPVPAATATPKSELSSVPTAAPTAVPSATPSSASGAVSKTGTITGDYVRFRSGPSTSYSIIATYNKGVSVTVTGVSNDWTACTINGKNGFIFSKYVKSDADSVSSASSETAASPSPSVSPVPSATPAPSPSPSATPAVSKAGYICGNNVRFRSGPSTSSEIIGEFYYANAVTITGTSGDWTAVSVDGKSGYVFSTYVKEGTYTVAESAKADSESSASSSSSASSASDTSSAVAGSGADVVSYAMQYLGTKYTWGGASPDTGFDCSGFVYYVYKHFGVTLNRVAQDQASNGSHVDAANLQPGDILCFYSSGNYIGHSGIYIGDGKFIHSCNSNTGVIITELSGSYAYRSYEARRIL